VTDRLPHRWKKSAHPEPHEFCVRCGLQRKKVQLDSGQRNRMRHRYNATVYRFATSDPWVWRTQKQGIRGCYGGLPPAGATP
jgi:hypothetical protein